MVIRQPAQWVGVSIEEILKSKDLRLEASVYVTEAAQATQKVLHNRYGFVPLRQVIDTHHCPRFKRFFVDKSNFGIYQPSQIQEIAPQPVAYISEKTDTNIDALRVKKGQILMTCSGTIGRVTYVSDTFDNLIFSHDLLRINVKNSDEIGYIYAYFLSKIGNSVIQSGNYGSVIQHIEPEHLLQLPIPNAPNALKTQIHEQVMDSFALRDKSNELLQQAQDLLQKSLNLPPLDAFKYPNRQAETWSISVEDLAGRFEASYHNPVVHRIEAHLQKHAKQVSTLSDKSLVSEISLPARFKRHYVSAEYGIPFLGGKEILELDPRGEKYLSKKQHADLIENQLLLQENMILITCSGTIGKTVLVSKHWQGWAASQHLLRVKPVNDDVAGYLAVWLKSPWALPLIQRHTYGSVIFEIDQYHLSEVAIPILDTATMKQINALALQANALRTQAFMKEQEALAMFGGIFDKS